MGIRLLSIRTTPTISITTGTSGSANTLLNSTCSQPPLGLSVTPQLPTSSSLSVLGTNLMVVRSNSPTSSMSTTTVMSASIANTPLRINTSGHSYSIQINPDVQHQQQQQQQQQNGPTVYIFNTSTVSTTGSSYPVLATMAASISVSNSFISTVISNLNTSSTNTDIGSVVLVNSLPTVTTVSVSTDSLVNSTIISTLSSDSFHVRIKSNSLSAVDTESSTNVGLNNLNENSLYFSTSEVII